MRVRRLKGGLPTREALLLSADIGLYGLAQPMVGCRKVMMTSAKVGRHGLSQTEVKGSEALLGAVNPFGGSMGQTVRQQGQPLVKFANATLCSSDQPPVQFVEQLNDGGAFRHEAFNGVGRCGCPNIGDQVRDEHVLLVADGRNDGYGAGHDGSDHGFEVEGPQVFGRATASANDDGIDGGQVQHGGDGRVGETPCHG